jgi:CheY-like chemotaxis protein
MAKTPKKTVLLVEDDEVLLRALYLLFHTSEFTVASATDGETALTMTQRLKPDVVLLDLLLPKMNGFDYLKFLKADPALQNIPVLVLSNLGDKENIDKAKTLGASDYFIKSDTDLSILAEKVNKMIK